MALGTALIEVFGCHNTALSKDHPEYWVISGPDHGGHLGTNAGDQGVLLRPKLTGAIDAPVKSLWLPGAFGQVFVDFRWERRDMVFTVFTFDPEEDTPEGWHTNDSLWRQGWDYVLETTIRYTYEDAFTPEPDVRELRVRMLEEPKAYEGDPWEGKDPHLYNCATVVMTVAAELPFYVGETDVYEWESVLASGQHTFDVSVQCDVPVWPRWILTDLARWTLPDRSFGNEEYGRGVIDVAREVPLPFLPLGAGCVADSDPRRQTLLAANKMHLQGLWGGKDLLYPLPNTAGLAGGTAPLTVKWAEATDGIAVRLEVPKWHTRPWSRPYVLT